MSYYPLFANLTDKACLVVGAGQVGARKIRSLLDSGVGSLTVIDTASPGEDLRAMMRDFPQLDYQTRQFRDTDVAGKFLVIASTSDEELNWRISNLCKDADILCNIVDQPEKCSFIVPAVYTQGNLTLAVSTGGASPAMARKVRQDLADYFGTQYGQFLELMTRLRPLVLDLGLPTSENTRLFRGLVESPLMEALGAGDLDRSREIMQRVLPPELHPKIPELMHELV
jgi:precorrin-2 dehydrogenase/sirohydrochlorin ferrochelatase